MILDLDGDGLEITPLSKGILFDANGDTIKNGTAWAASDDGAVTVSVEELDAAELCVGAGATEDVVDPHPDSSVRATAPPESRRTGEGR